MRYMDNIITTTSLRREQLDITELNVPLTDSRHIYHAIDVNAVDSQQSGIRKSYLNH